MDLFSLQTSIEIDISNAIDKLQELSLKASEISSKIRDGLGKTEIKIDTSTSLDSLKVKTEEVAAAEEKNSESAKELTDDIKKLTSEVKKDKQELNEAKKSSDQLDNSLDKLDSSSNKLASGGFTILKGAIANLISSGLMRLVASFKSLVSSAGQYQSSMEQYTTSFEVMTGSASKAVDITKELAQIAASTPFEMTNLADTTQLLMNYGLTADEAIERMTMLGDISQGNAEKMTRIAAAYGQMSSAGKVNLQDIKQMIEAGFNPLQEISQTTGESMDSLYKRISKGTLSIDEITASMERSTAAGGKYFGSMEKQSQTLSGRLSTLRDTINSSLGTAMSGILTKIADDLLPKITAKIESIDWDKIGNTLTSIFDKVVNIGTWMANNIGLVSTFIVGLVSLSGVLKIYKVASGLAADSTTMFNSALTAITNHPIIATIAAIAGMLIYAYNTNEEFRNSVNALAQDLMNTLKPLLESFKPIFEGLIAVVNSILPVVQSVFQLIVVQILNALKVITPIIKGLSVLVGGLFKAWSICAKPFIFVLQWIVDLITNIKKLIGGALNSVLGIFGIKIEAPKSQVKWNAEGAIFDKPTIFDTPLGLQGVGEAGAEAVTPIDKLQGYVKNAVHEETYGIVSSIERFMEMMAEYMPVVIKGQNKQVVLDSGVLVGQMANQMDIKLAQIQSMKERGV